MAATQYDDPRHRRLLEAVRRAAADGYDAVSMRALAADTRMSLATIYQFAASKDELIAQAHAGGMDAFRAAVARRPPRGATADARVRSVLRRFADALEQDETRTRTLMRALYSTEPNVAPSRQSVGASFAALIDAAIGEERVPNRDDVIDVLGHVVNSVTLSWLNGRLTITEVRGELDRATRTLLSRTSLQHPA